jgi:hypothetical protein
LSIIEIHSDKKESKRTNQMSMNKLSRNRRGEDMIIDFWAILIFALIIIVFFIIFSAEKGRFNARIETQFANKDTDFMLDSFLRAPLLDNPQKTISDVIIEESSSGKFTKTQVLFEQFFKRTTQINGQEVNNMLLKIDDNDPISITAPNGYGWFGKATTIAWEKVKGYFSVLSQPSNPALGIALSMHKEAREYSAQTYLPGYEKKIQVQLVIGSWTYDTAIISSENPTAK